MDFSKTVNLPKTDFPMKANLPQREPEAVKKWEAEGLYKKMQAKNKTKEQKFVLHDGPPYANGNIHLGTSLNKILKDIIVKYKNMQGFYSPYTPGWDCHGLPIEQALMKELKVDKHKVDRLSFRKKAAEFAKKFIDIQRNEFKRLGVLSDWDKPYLTLDPKYEGVIVKVFRDLLKSGYIYRQKKPVYWCPTCETAMADAEVEYADHVSHSVFVKFKINTVPTPINTKLDPSFSVLIWTTTPWTLPANVALAFNGEEEYVSVKLKLKDESIENLVLAKKLLPSVTEKLGALSHEIINEFTGKDLEGIKCQNPLMERESVGILAGYVSMEDGTGVVHIAPGHGQEDYQAGLKYKLPIISPVNDRGVFTEEAGEFKGNHVFKVNDVIVAKLLEKKSLLFEAKLTHSYPHCWRCKKPIIFRATEQWFLSVEYKNLRNRMFEAIKKVNWVPDYGQNRINGMVESRPDWCLSRQRLWGVPIPVLYCKDCDQPLLDDKIIDKAVSMIAEQGSDVWYEKTVEEILDGTNIKCKCGSADFKKEEDILDVWFDSGVSSFAVLESKNFEGLDSLPADMYLEGSDQHRGWFQTSLIPAVALRERAPYKTVLTHGFVVDGEGKKMSKSIGNVILPQEIFQKYGADILRLWVATSDYREDIRISQEIINGLSDSYRKIRNTLKFILGNLGDFSMKDKVAYENMREIDQYALTKLNEVVSTTIAAYEGYQFHTAVVSLNVFCSVFLSNFCLDALKDTLYCDAANSKTRRSAQSALYEICSTLIRLLAPILSFSCEEAFAELKKINPELEGSVFLADFPKHDKTLINKANEELKIKWEQLLTVREKAMLEFEALRKDKQIGSNLEAHAVIHCDFTDKELLSSVVGTWDIELKNSKEIKIEASKSKLLKCERCWRYTADTKKVEAYEGIVCGRCASVLAEIKPNV